MDSPAYTSALTSSTFSSYSGKNIDDASLVFGLYVKLMLHV